MAYKDRPNLLQLADIQLQNFEELYKNEVFSKLTLYFFLSHHNDHLLQAYEL